MKYLLPLFLCLCQLLSLAAAPRSSQGERFDFSDAGALKSKWLSKGKRFGIPMTSFAVVYSATAGDKRALAVRASQSTGFIVTKIPDKVWSKYPVLRWRWRISCRWIWCEQVRYAIE